MFHVPVESEYTLHAKASSLLELSCDTVTPYMHKRLVSSVQSTGVIYAKILMRNETKFVWEIHTVWHNLALLIEAFSHGSLGLKITLDS